MQHDQTSIDSLTVVRQKMLSLFDDVFQHDGFGELKVEFRILKRQTKRDYYPLRKAIQVCC